ncbi:MAG: hypothetical protein WA688_10370 [Thermoplasmata archaeon]
MVAWALVAAALAGIVIALVYCYVAYRFSRRPVSSNTQMARAQFTIFWYGLGVTAALSALEAALAAAGALSLSIAVTVGLVGVLIDCVFLWAIVDVLIYLYTGRYYFAGVAVLYGLFYVAALYYTILERPYGVVIRAGIPTLLVEPVTVHALVAVVDVGLVFPEFIVAVLYLSLLRRTRDRTQRFRIAVVGLSIIAWFGLTFFYPSSTAAETFERAFLQLVPALLALVAYLPPEWMRTRFRILGIDASTPQ